MNSLSRDLLFAWRLLQRSPGFAVITILCFALGMGATTAVFTVVDAVLFRPLPYTNPERLVRIYTEFPTFPNGGLRRFSVSPPEFLEMRDALGSYEHLDAWQVGAVNLATAQEPVRVTATLVSGTLFQSLGIRPQLGRWINADDDKEGASLAILISDGLWKRSYGGASDVVGRETKLNGLSARVVGVMPKGFQYPPGQVDVSEVWMPLQLTAADGQRRGNHRLAILGKLRSGISIAQARQELAARTKAWGERRSNNFHTIHPEDHPLLEFGMQDEVVRTVRPAMLVILGAVGFVLLIACVNVANLLLARAEARQKEISVRVAIGAGRRALVRQFIAEGFLISVAGALCGLGIAFIGVRLLLWAGAEAIPRAEEVSIDWRVLGITGAVVIATAIFFGLAPLVQAIARNTHETLKANTGRNSATASAAMLRRALVVVELSLALVLFISCGLMLETFWRLQAVKPGFDPANRLTMRIALPTTQYSNDAAMSFLAQLEEKLAGIPGVVSSALMNGLPPQRPPVFNDTQIENFAPRPGGPVQNVDFYQTVGPRYLETLGARLVEGRFIDERDSQGAPAVVMINETMARTFWPGQSALGHRLRPSGGPADAPWRSIVGVVADIKNGGADQPTGTELFMPWRQVNGMRLVQVLLHTERAPESVVSAARTVIAQLDPTLPVTAIRTMDEVVSQSQSRPRFLSVLLTFFTTVALALAAIGVYGVISYSVARRTAEFGIRMAVGADRSRILRMVLNQAALLGLIGVTVGVIAAFWLTRFMKSILFATEPLDLPTFAATAAMLFIVTLLASWLPARRATRIDPNIALRYD
jgi:putative ABC transport system permease protein